MSLASAKGQEEVVISSSGLGSHVTLDPAVTGSGVANGPVGAAVVGMCAL